MEFCRGHRLPLLGEVVAAPPKRKPLKRKPLKRKKQEREQTGARKRDGSGRNRTGKSGRNKRKSQRAGTKTERKTAAGTEAKGTGAGRQARLVARGPQVTAGAFAAADPVAQERVFGAGAHGGGLPRHRPPRQESAFLAQG